MLVSTVEGEIRTLKYLIANSGVCNVSEISKRGSSARETASCKDLDRGLRKKGKTGKERSRVEGKV